MSFKNKILIQAIVSSVSLQVVVWGVVGGAILYNEVSEEADFEAIKKIKAKEKSEYKNEYSHEH